MLSIKNRGMEIIEKGSSQGGISTLDSGAITSLMLMKSDPELFVHETVFERTVGTYTPRARMNGETIDAMLSIQPKKVFPRTIKCVKGFTKK